MEYLKIAGLIYMVVAIIIAFWLESPKVEDWMERDIAKGNAGKVADAVASVLLIALSPLLALFIFYAIKTSGGSNVS